MKKLFSLFITILMTTGAFVPSAYGAGKKPVIAIDAFRNASCSAKAWWWPRTGDELAVSLINQLSDKDNFEIIKNQTIRDHILEKDLDIEGRILKKSTVELGRATGAGRLVMFQVKEFREEIVVKKKEGLFSSGGTIITDGEKTVSVEVRILDANSGEEEFAAIIEGASEKDENKSRDFKGDFDGTLGNMADSRLEKALRATVVKISEYLECVMVHKDDCQAGYRAEEKKR